MKAVFLEDYFGNFDTDIHTVYPKNNDPIFEKWCLKNYHKFECNSERCYLPIQWTAYYVNNNYGQDKSAIQKLQEYINKLHPGEKYWTCVQYDDGILNDVSRIDLLQFNMSKKIGVEMPLLCQPHPYKFDTPKKYIASFVGSRTHPIRNELEKFKGKDGWYISFEPHSIEDYCRILHESWFSICPRGYGLNSFRISESLQYGAIPIYLSDEFITPYTVNGELKNLPAWWLLVNSHSADNIPFEIERLTPEQVIDLKEMGENAYELYYTYEGAMKQIIKILESGE